MKRITEAKLRQIVREELLNENKFNLGNLFGGAKSNKEVLLEIKGSDVINKFHKINERDQKIPLPLREFKIDYEFASKREKEELKNVVVLKFIYNHAKLFNRGYIIQILPLSNAVKQSNQLFVSHEKHEMTSVSRRTDRNEIQKYESILDITVPEPTGKLDMQTTSRLDRQPLSSSGKEAEMASLIARIKGETPEELSLDKGVRENKKRKR